MSHRRSLRHLVALVAAGGLITLAVVVTGITPVWLAAGPLLLVIIDTLVYSPSVRMRVRDVAELVSRRGRSSPATRHQLEPAYLALSLSERYGLRVLELLISVVGVAVAIAFLPLSVWLGLVALLFAFVAVAQFASRRGAQYELEVSLFPPHIHVGPSSLGLGLSPPGSPMEWLQLQLDETGTRPLSVAVVGI